MSRFGQLAGALVLALGLTGPAQADDGKETAPSLLQTIVESERDLSKCLKESAGFQDEHNVVGEVHRAGQAAIVDDASVVMLYRFGGLRTVHVSGDTYRYTHHRATRRRLVSHRIVSSSSVKIAHDHPVAVNYASRLEKLTATCAEFTAESEEPKPPHASDAESHPLEDRAHQKHSEHPPPRGGPQ